MGKRRCKSSCGEHSGNVYAFTLNNEVGNYAGVSLTTDVLNWEFFPSGPDPATGYTVANLVDTSLPGSPAIFEGTLGFPSGSGIAQLTPIQQTPVPESATGVLMLLEVGMVFVMKRISHLHRNPPIAVTAILTGQSDDGSSERLFVDPPG